MASRFQRQHCFLCDLPHSPWAILHDFSEPICRGCCNYEGAERIEDIIHYSRLLRKNWEKSERNAQHGVKNDRLNSTGSSVSSTPSPPPSSRGAHQSVNNGGANYLSAEQRQAYSKYASQTTEDSLEINNSATVHHKLTSTDPKSAPGSRMVPGIKDDRRGSTFSDDARHALINGTPIVSRPHPGPLVGPLAPPPHIPLDSPRQEHMQAHATLSLLNRSVPFDIRFKKDHTSIGRIFVFDVNNKPGLEFELKIFIEYPRGSGCVFQSVAGVVKKMHSELHKDIGRTHTSGVKYLEYEKDRGTGDWRMLADLLPESVRYFKEPVKQELLPRPQLDSEYPLPNVNLSFNPRPGTMYGRKRKGTMDLEEYEITSGNRMGHPGREETMHQHPAWVQNQVDGGKLVMTAMSAPPGTPVSSIPSASVSPMVTTPISKVASMQLPPSEVHVRAQSKSPINNSVMRGSHFEVAGAPRDEGRGNNLVSAGHMSPHSRSPRPPTGPLSKSAETQSGLPNDGDGKEKEKGSSGQSILRCSLCRDKLEDTHFVQCPSIMHHKFCFPCSRDSIKKQGAGTEVFCPSGERCPLQGSNLPWAFMQGEIQTILGTEFIVKKEKDSQ
ncbi:probable E3 ubiquitin-protein ligase IRF2BPL [Nematostella vectensis]|uniref:probable E3 ubiquitin-protein ligase IRF2BPL n=1 Tax=Nematostella vectensis TaxID=45351 RepID=UPI0020779086|nr:probable E3 ubiquitin-protein ligase IRF2BPL [Nematostella vectensis]